MLQQKWKIYSNNTQTEMKNLKQQYCYWNREKNIKKYCNRNRQINHCNNAASETKIYSNKTAREILQQK